MSGRGITLSPEVVDVLRRSRTDGYILRLPEGQLERALYTSVDKAIRMLGGKWDRRQGGHIFPFDPSFKVAAAISNSKVVSRQQALQLFETPQALAVELVGELGDIKGKTCLEPSAGRGRIVTELLSAGAGEVACVEIDADNGNDLERQGHSVLVADFLGVSADTMTCDAGAMNPPFTRNQDIQHVRHAFACLRPGGRLASIVSEHGFAGNERECTEWRDWLRSLSAKIEIIPAGAFKKSGTSIQTRMIVVTKGTYILDSRNGIG